MIEIKGSYTTAKIFASKYDDKTVSKIGSLVNSSFLADSKIRVMPDCHDGKGAVIGTTILLKNKVAPSLVGVDIGCGMLLIKLGKININFKEFDQKVRSLIPLGKNIRDDDSFVLKDELGSTYKKAEELFNSLLIKEKILSKKEYVVKSIGSLGGGNHFIEIDKSEEGDKYLIIHTGSRNLGKLVEETYEEIATSRQKSNLFDFTKEMKEIISKHKSNHTEYLIEEELTHLKEKQKEFEENYKNESLAYLEKEDFTSYIHDMGIAQQYASLNRETIARLIVTKALNLDYETLEKEECIHNYIDLRKLHGSYILRKGAISSELGEKVIIPINMRDGVILGVGKGNEDFNFSAPHGAGRLMSRNEAKKEISLDSFKESMKEVFSTSVKEETLDESPFAYKSFKDIEKYLKETVDIKEIIKPIYNLKADN